MYYDLHRHSVYKIINDIVIFIVIGKPFTLLFFLTLNITTVNDKV